MSNMQGYQQSALQMNQQQQQQQQVYQYHQQPQSSQVQVSRFYKSTEQTLNTENSSVYLALLGLAESFQQASKYNLCIHCLESIFIVLKQDKQMPSFHFQLKIVLVKNLKSNDEFKYEAAYTVYKLFQKQKIAQIKLKMCVNSKYKQSSSSIDPSQTISLFSLDLLNHVLETSAMFPLWHIRLLFLISDILVHERECLSAAHFLALGIDYCAKNNMPTYTHLMFILNKGLVHLIDRNSNDLQTTMQPCAAMIENFQAANQYQLESLKIFFLVLQVTYFLQAGQMRSVKNTLKSLQHFVQSMARRFNDCNESAELSLVLANNPLENFTWIHKDHATILAFLLTATHFMQSGLYERALSSCDKAIHNIHKLKSRETFVSPNGARSLLSIYSYNCLYVTNVFRFMAGEIGARCQIALANRCGSIKHIADLFNLCHSETRLMSANAPRLHCLLGLYSASMNFKDEAISHLRYAHETSPNENDLYIYSAMNLAYTLLNTQSPNLKSFFISFVDKTLPENIKTQNTALDALARFFKAIKCFSNENYEQAKESLKEAMNLANSEELNGVACNASIFVGHLCLLMGQYHESFERIKYGADIAEKMADCSLKSYANSLFKELFKQCNDPREAESTQKHQECENKLTSDFYEACKMPEHSLINWSTDKVPIDLLQNINKQLAIRASSQAQLNNQSIQSPQQQQQQQQQTIINSPNFVNQYYQNTSSPVTPITPKTMHHATNIQSPLTYSPQQFNYPQQSIHQQQQQSPYNQQQQQQQPILVQNYQYHSPNMYQSPQQAPLPQPTVQHHTYNQTYNQPMIQQYQQQPHQQQQYQVQSHLRLQQQPQTQLYSNHMMNNNNNNHQI